MRFTDRMRFYFGHVLQIYERAIRKTSKYVCIRKKKKNSKIKSCTSSVHCTKATKYRNRSVEIGEKPSKPSASIRSVHLELHTYIHTYTYIKILFRMRKQRPNIAGINKFSHILDLNSSESFSIDCPWKRAINEEIDPFFDTDNDESFTHTRVHR